MQRKRDMAGPPVKDVMRFEGEVAGTCHAYPAGCAGHPSPGGGVIRWRGKMDKKVLAALKKA